MSDIDAVPSPAFEEWASEEGINNFHFNHCWDAWQAALRSVADHIADERYQWLRRQVWFQRAVDENIEPTNHLDEMDSVIDRAASSAGDQT
jgi:hypothetical protein